jgi:CheY-like chemotaxis protein
MGLRCLIVDDSRPFLRAAQGLLEREGIRVVAVASNSADALRQAEELRPDLALVDIDLGPENGFDLATQLDGRGRSEPGADPPTIILISSHAEEDFEELIAGSPAIGFVGKAALSASAIHALMEARS